MTPLLKSRKMMAAFSILAAMAFGLPALRAQIMGQIEAKVTFPFTVENTKLPAGDYIIRPVDEETTPTLELSTTDGKVAVLVTPENAQARQLPKVSELVFDKIGDQEFLREIWVESGQYGYTFVKTKAETKFEKVGSKSVQHRTTAKHNRHKKTTS